MDKYNINALYIPTFFLTILLILIFNVLRVDIEPVMTELGKISFEIDGITITASLVLLVVGAKLIRYCGKHLVETPIFENGMKFPTTLYLTKNSHELSKSKKNKIFQLLKEDFGFDISQHDSLSEEELREVSDFVGSIRREVKDGSLTLEHNIRYGQARNIIGGMFIVVPLLLFCNGYCIYNSQYGIIENLLFGINVVFILILLSRKSIIKKYADEYARMLFDDYIALKRN
jgi:hypothetical protein